MALTEGQLLFVGVLAAGIGFMGLFVTLDVWTNVLLIFLSAFIWGIFGISAFQVKHVNACCEVHQEAMPLVILGIGMAAMTALFGIAKVFEGVRSDAQSADLDLG